MRSNKWKMIVLIAVAFIIGVVGGTTVVKMLPEAYSMYRGLAGFGTIILIAGAIVMIAVKIFHIGRD